MMGVSGAEWQHTTETLISLAKNSGCKVFRYQMYANDWVDDITGWMTGEKYQAKLIQIRQWCKTYGILFWLDCTCDVYNPPEGYNTHYSNVMSNVGGAGDTWLSLYSGAISTLLPDVVGLMNEPGTGNYANYKTFLTRCMNAYRAIKPDLKFAACSLPFYDFTAVANSPIAGVDFYEFHDYYMFDNTYPPAYETGQRAYWDGNLAQAKTLQAQRWLDSDVHLQMMIDAGLPVVMSEAGTHNLNPNYLVFMQDLFDFMKAHSIGVLQHEFRAWDSVLGYYEAGIFNSDNVGNAYASWSTLNALGQVWAENMKA
jgi:hypothetical protein